MKTKKIENLTFPRVWVWDHETVIYYPGAEMPGYLIKNGKVEYRTKSPKQLLGFGWWYSRWWLKKVQMGAQSPSFIAKCAEVASHYKGMPLPGFTAIS